jgi:hypothetical protein
VFAFASLHFGNAPEEIRSFARNPESSTVVKACWVPAFAGTNGTQENNKKKLLRHANVSRRLASPLHST